MDRGEIGTNGKGFGLCPVCDTVLLKGFKQGCVESVLRSTKISEGWFLE